MSIRQWVKAKADGPSNRLHTCVVFGGWDPSYGKIKYDSSGAAKFAEQCGALGLTVKDERGAAAMDGIVIERALTFVQEHFSPKGKLIVYGYSAGGIDALEFVRAMHIRASSYTDGKLAPTKRPLAGTMHGGTLRDEHPDDALVDLLITIDPYQPYPKEEWYSVPRNVVRFVNIYQRWEQRLTGSAGRPLRRAERNARSERDLNEDRTDRKEYRELGPGDPGGGAHGFIDEDTLQFAFEQVEALVGG